MREPSLALFHVLAVTAAALVWATPAHAEDGSDDTPLYPGQAGQVEPTSGGFVGQYISGTLPETEVVIGQFMVAGIPLIDAIRLTAYVQEEREIEGASVHVEGTAGQLELFDAPAAYLTLKVASGAVASVDPATGASLVAAGSGAFRLESGAVSGLLWPDCGGSAISLVDGEAVLASSGSGCRLHFRADTQAHPLDSGDLEAALTAGQLAAEVTVEGQDEDYAVSHVASFEAIEVEVQAAEGRVVVAISGNVAGPRSVVILLPERLLPAGSSVEATLDGRPMVEAPSAAQALAVAGQGDNGSFARVSASGVLAVVLAVPSFSVHLIELATGAGLAPTSARAIPLDEAAVPLALAGGAVVAAAVAILRRPED